MKTIRDENIEMHIYNQAKFGNSESGDTYYVHKDEEYCLFSIADGLGSGPAARRSAEVIPTVLKNHQDESLGELLIQCNQLMASKRGATAAVVKVNFKERKVEFSSVGNVRFYILQNGAKMIYPLPVRGYLSGKPQKIKTLEYDYLPGDLFFMHSDGVALKSANLLLKESFGANEIYAKALQSVEKRDDATFIAGSLL